MTAETIHYNLRFSKLHQHVVDVEAFFPTYDSVAAQIKPQIVIMLPVWTPGSYLVREYARNIEAIEACEASTGAPLSIQKLSKNRWSIECLDSQHVCVRYSLYCRESSVRTNWVEAEYGFLTGAATFLTLDDDVQREHTFDILPPDSWPTIACSLPKLQSEVENDEGTELWHSFSRKAASYDELVDSPILMGDIAVRSFEVSGKLHYLASYGTNGAWDLDRATADCARSSLSSTDFGAMSPIPAIGLST